MSPVDGARKRILFVDDEPRILDGLRRMLRGMRQDWEIEFASSGQEALGKLAAAPYDVLITDMRMPGMDGAELLHEVMARHPEVVRIVLSGQADEELIRKSVGPTHQYLTKPCDPQILKTTVARAFNLRRLLRDESLKGLIARVQSLPCLPELYEEVIRELQSPAASLKKIGAIISKDVAMSAKILQLVNSALFGLFHRITTPAHAVSILGLDTIKSLVLSVGVFSQYKESHLKAFSLADFMQHSTAVGALAREIARSESADWMMADASFLGGLLHDAGKLLLATNLPELYGEALEQARRENRPIWEVETRVFGGSHAEVGAYLMGLWGLSDPIVEAIAYHHAPSRCPGDRFAPVTAVHVADRLVNESPGSGVIDEDARLDREYLERLGLLGRLEVWREQSANQRRSYSFEGAGS